MDKKLNTCLMLALGGLVAACGGGGGSGGGGSEQPTLTSIEGGYTAVANSGSSGSAIILEDGSLWAISGVESGGVLFVDALIQGPLAVSGSSVSSTTLREYDFASSTTMAGIGFSGSRASSGVISGSVTATGFNPIAFTLTPVAAAEFDYEQAATLAAIAGSWDGFFSTGDSGAVVISATGAVSSLTDAGCSISGSVVPRPSGKNIYNVTIAFGPAPCALPNGSASGIAVIAAAGAERQLTVGVTTADRSLGAAFFGTR